MHPFSWRSAFLVASTLFAVSSAQAQVGLSAQAIKDGPLFQGAKKSGNVYNLQGGGTVLLREKSGFLISAVVFVSQKTKVNTSLTMTGDSSGAEGTGLSQGGSASVARAAELVGLLTGLNAGMTQPLTVFLNRPDVQSRLAAGMTVTALPLELKPRLKGNTLIIEVALKKVEEGQFLNTTDALAPKKASAKPITVRVFSDFQCPYCHQFEGQTMPEMLKLLPDDVKIEFHQLPLEQIHPLARPAAEASECAAQQEQFWAYKDALFADKTWMQNNPNMGFIALADKLKLNVTTFKNCLAERGGKDSVDLGLQSAARLGINSTPTVFVNGYRVSNPYDPASVLMLINFARAAR